MILSQGINQSCSHPRIGVPVLLVEKWMGTSSSREYIRRTGLFLLIEHANRSMAHITLREAIGRNNLWIASTNVRSIKLCMLLYRLVSCDTIPTLLKESPVEPVHDKMCNWEPLFHMVLTGELRFPIAQISVNGLVETSFFSVSQHCLSSEKHILTNTTSFFVDK